MTIALAQVPEGTTRIEVRFAGQILDIPVQENAANRFAGCRAIVTMNKNNDLDWVRQWVDWHVKLHGTDTVVIIENGSSAYTKAELETTIAKVPGISKVAVIDWPHLYGPHDPAVLFHPYWANFLQASSFTMMFHRLLARAAGVINCDVDELVGTRDGQSAYDVAAKDPHGLITLKGTWVEPVIPPSEASGFDHLAYRFKAKNPLKSICANKWALDPSRDWLKDLNVMPGVHRIYGRPKSEGRKAPKLSFFHFKAINTNWKHNRNIAVTFDPKAHQRILALDAEISRYRKASTSR